MRSIVFPLLLSVAVAVAAPAAAADGVRVTATADLDGSRVLVRWQPIDASTSRFPFHDVLRRDADGSVETTLNAVPVGPMDTVVEIVTLFDSPGYEDAKAWILETFGDDYASDLLALGDPGADDAAAMQARVLPDLNYGAAIALGLGFMDETVVDGTTYVYEVWGLDELGFRVERLGRATATAGSPPPTEAVVSPRCVDVGDVRGDMRAFLHWQEPAAPTERGIGLYDLWRVPADTSGQCTGPNGPGANGAVRVNAFPTQRIAQGASRRGAQVFQDRCVACHSVADPRTIPPDQGGVAGGTIADFYRRMYPDLWDIASMASHDTFDLRAMSAEDVRAAFDWIQEFHFVDDGEVTPSDPLVEGETYCYRVLGRDLLGQHGIPGVEPACTILDRDPPRVPWAVQATRVPAGPGETCEVSWARNDDPGDDTVSYLVYRMSPDPPRASADPAKRVSAPDPDDPSTPPLGTVPHPVAGDRMSFTDPGLTVADAGERFFYGIAAKDDAGNVSDFSGWAPCVPRDLQAPSAPTLAVGCCAEGGTVGCEDKTSEDPDWVTYGGDPVVMWNPRADQGDCTGVRITPTLPGDAIGVRLYRSLDGTTFHPAEDIAGPFDESFTPLVDTPVYVQAKAFDASGNLGPASDVNKFMVWGLPLPPPSIVSVTRVPTPSMPARIKIRFRSLSWNSLLGFALYRHNVDPAEAIPADIGTFVRLDHPTNFNTAQPPDPVWPTQWTTQPGAQPLSGLLSTSEPTSDEYLFYDDLDQSYVLQVDAGDLEGLVLNLVAISWSGVEGQYAPYRPTGDTPDGVLEWPKFRDRNRPSFALIDDLAATWNPAAQTIQLNWTANPKEGGAADACTDSLEMPFVIFRKRGTARRWEQISPPFGCDGTNPGLQFVDQDVQSGFRYTYTVVRLNRAGEFWASFGPVSEEVP